MAGSQQKDDAENPWPYGISCEIAERIKRPDFATTAEIYQRLCRMIEEIEHFEGSNVSSFGLSKEATNES